MNEHEIENVLQNVLEAVLRDGLNYPVTIILDDNTVFYGFRLLENGTRTITGLTKEQKAAAVNNPHYSATIIRKSHISAISCPTLDAGGIQIGK
jgi:hypothetical protein